MFQKSTAGMLRHRPIHTLVFPIYQMQQSSFDCMKKSQHPEFFWHSTSKIWESVNSLQHGIFHCWLFVGHTKWRGEHHFCLPQVNLQSKSITSNREVIHYELQIFQVCYKVCIMIIQQISNRALKVLRFGIEPSEIEISRKLLPYSSWSHVRRAQQCILWSLDAKLSPCFTPLSIAISSESELLNVRQAFITVLLVDKSGWATILAKNPPPGIIIYDVKSLGQVHGNLVQWYSLLNAFLLSLSYQENHIHSTTAHSKTTLCLWNN